MDQTVPPPSRSSPRSYSAATTQSLSSILNNPGPDSSSSWASSWWPASDFSPINPSRAPVPDPDFRPYLASLSDPISQFEDIQKHKKRETVDDTDGGRSGDALAACLREVPALYFKEDFALKVPSESPNKLLGYLDVVEVHLVREISLRSDSFYEAQRRLEDLSGRIVEGCKRIRELKESVRVLDESLVESARRIQGLSGTRGNLLVLQEKLRVIFYVNQAVSALKLLVASGDCAGALDVTDDLQNLLEGEELTGLYCFRHLRDHVASAIDDVNSILSAEFMRTSVHDTGNMDEVILSKAKARARANLLRNGEDDEVKVDEEDTSNFRDQFLPVTIGLLRTAKLPSVLRMYRDTVTADMKGAIKTAVADLLPVLLTRPLESDLTPGDRAVETDGGGSSLASKLRSLSSESFIQLLEAIFSIITAHLVRASEVKRAIEWIMCNIDGHYAADSVANAIALGSMASEAAAQEREGQAASYSSYRNVVPSFQTKANDGTSTSSLSKNFRADVLRENTEAVFAACDIAHGRWAKLLGVRALVHPRLKLQEFLSIFNVTQEFIAATEKVGGRLGYSIRGTLQSQAKAFIDFQHEARMSKIKAVLDQETWTEVDVPQEFQAIVTSLFSPESLRYVGEDDGEENSNNIVASNNNHPLMAETGISNSQKISPQKESVDKTTHIKSSPPAQADNNIKSDSKERGKVSSQTLEFGGLGYHMVNCGLILVKMLSEYIEMNNYLPVLSSEVVHRVVELLKFFNTRTCQLVLGAGAMQVSGLKSITSKHLALASQVVSFTFAIIPEIRRILFIKVPETRKALLLSEIDRVAQDYKVHRDEIHTKLVQIMRERLLVHLRSLPQIVEGWNRIEESDSLPSQFARSLTKEVGYLQRVLSRTLHEVDVQAIFRQVVIIFHSQISEVFSQLDINTPQAKNRLQRDVEHILACIRSLPSDSPSKNDVSNWGQLDELLRKRFGPLAD